MANILDSTKIVGDNKVAEHLLEWKEELAGISDPIKRQNTAMVLANISSIAEREYEALTESWNIGSGNTGLNAPYGSFGQGPTTIYPAGQFAPQVVAMTRRTLPYLIAGDIFGTQALSGPVGVGFGFKYRRFTQGGDLAGDAAGANSIPPIGTRVNSRGQQLAGGGTVVGPDGTSYQLAPINFGAGPGDGENTANNVAYTADGTSFFYADGPKKGQPVPKGAALFPEAGWQEVPDYVGFTGARKGRRDLPFEVENKSGARTGYNFGNKVNADSANGSEWGQAVTNEDLRTRGPSTSSEGWGITKDWNQIDAEGLDFKMPELGFDLTEIIFRTGDRQLAASISNKTKAYLKSMHGLEAEKEMWNMLDFLVKLEKDREAILRARALAYHTGWTTGNDGTRTRVTTGSRSYEDLSFNRGGDFYGSDSAYFTYTLDCSTVKGRWAQEVFAIIPFMILRAAQDIRVRNLRNPGNFCIVSPKVATILNVCGEIFAGFKTNVNGNIVTPEIGTLNGNIKVYCDNFAKDDVITVGYKGPGVADAAAIYTPYIDSLELRGTDPTDFAARIGVMSSYGYTENLLNGDIYISTIALKNIDQMFILASAAGNTP